MSFATALPERLSQIQASEFGGTRTGSHPCYKPLSVGEGKAAKRSRAKKHEEFGDDASAPSSHQATWTCTLARNVAVDPDRECLTAADALRRDGIDPAVEN
jgi:hypothetical protein